ncbi:hypothetical protein COV05_03770 [Candidatus Uhrbacteria bacterium CG10_big_fil_rev_8_21_14_0_10_48_16]|uniref:Uncharacterized protein n=1 Tax=Candidatus Uhrbacteria bacterium CG10_big_fil_rev_8_21_14_0_10_48_16 TaxID=1975038 RepID=A0A2M8LG78_9BACT|nr:MAG: hypothetical protein COV05_03770 [Candidatus Uhrbacteria bacterium CG10_big_fil_rev_8_21_14_0_10_48_16]
MTLLLTLKILGWMLTLIPFTAFVIISVNLIKGVGKDDALILALALLGLTMFLMGVIILVVSYLTNFL